MTQGSFLAVLRDGTHRAMTGVFASPNVFDAWVRENTEHVRHNLARFVYAWGGEFQEYTPAEVREVFHKE